MTLSAAGFEAIVGCVLIGIATVFLAFSNLAYRMIDATAGRTAEKWAKAGADASWRMYRRQRPLLRWGLPLVLLLTGIVAVVDGLS